MLLSSRCRAAASRLRLRLRENFMSRSMFSWCASSGVPGHEELAMGAIASGGVKVLNRDVIRMLHISESDIEAAAAREALELERREREYRGDRPPLEVQGRTIILIDDGIATGATMRAAIAALRRRGAGKIVVAVPVAAPATCVEMESDVDEMVCLATPAAFEAVGEWYKISPKPPMPRFVNC